MRATVAALLLAALSCRRSTPSADAATNELRSDVQQDLARPGQVIALDLAAVPTRCTFGYRGSTFDLGNPRIRSHFGARLEPPTVTWVEREGSRWASFHSKSTALDVYVVPPADAAAEGPPDAMPFALLHARGGAAKTISVSLNGHALGTATLPRDETRTIVLRGRDAAPVPGNNELVIRFSGVAKGSGDTLGDVDWIHFGTGDADPTYPAPSEGEVAVSANFAGVPLRALSLRAPGFARCDGWLPAGGTVVTRARMDGPGDADVEVRLIRDRVPPAVIGTMHLEGTTGGDRELSWPMGDVGSPDGVLGAIELDVTRASHGGRVVFGAPRVIVAPDEARERAPSPPPARNVVLVVLGQVAPHLLASYGGTLGAGAIASVARTGLVFDTHRATTVLASGAIGAMLAGVPPTALGLLDPGAALPKSVTTIADAARQAGIISAFITENPLTGAAFGFDRGWSVFEAHGPTDDGPPERAFDSAAAFVEAHAKERFLLVVHARGGHPPWNVPAERIKALPPENYTGGLDARHAGELLARSARSPAAFRFEEADRVRAWALYDAALDAEEEGFGRLLSSLDAAGVRADTTIIVTSDIGLDEVARVPFGEPLTLREGSLAKPLIVSWAHEDLLGRHVTQLTSDEDVATSVLVALGLSAPVTFQGRDLAAEIGGPRPRFDKPALAAYADRFSLRYGSLVSEGSGRLETKLCDLSLEPSCLTDVRSAYPLASRALHEALFQALVDQPSATVREPANIDPKAAAALKAWGR